MQMGTAYATALPAFVPGGAVAEGSTLSIAGESSATLYRAVQAGELASVESTGTYNLVSGMGEVKGFFGTAEEASTFAQRFYTQTGGTGGPFTLTSGTFPTSVIPEGTMIGGEGTAYFLPATALESVPPTVMNYFPLP